MRLFAFFIGLAILILTTWIIWGGRMEENFSLMGSVEWLRAAGPWGGVAGILLLLGDLALPIPSTLVISALGYLYGIWLGGILASIGLIGAGVIGYGVGYLCGEKRARQWLGERDFNRGQALFTKGGGWVVALSRALPILPEVISCTAGLVRMPFYKFLTSLICGSVPMAFIFASIGHLGQAAPSWALGMSVAIPALLWAMAARLKY